MSIKKLMVVVASLVVSVGVGHSFMSKDSVGTTSGQFLKLGVSAKSASMGESFTGIADDATAIYYNPAGISQLKNKEVSVLHSIWFEDISYNWVSYVHPLDIGNFGVGVQYVNYGSFKGMDEDGNSTTDFSPADIAITVSYGKTVAKVLVGGSIKYIMSKIDKTATAVAIDIGGIYKMMEDKLSLGMAIQNLGTTMKYVEKEEKLPLWIKVGAGYKATKCITASLDINLPSDGELVIGLGGDYNYKVNEDIGISGRLGYNTGSKDVVGDLKGLSVGLGGSYKNYSLDYAVVPFGDLGLTHRISIGVRF